MLNERHLNTLLTSGLSVDSISNAGYYSTAVTIDNKEEGCFAVPCVNPFTGKTIVTRYRLDNPSGKRKYYQHAKTPQAIYFSKLIENWSSKASDPNLGVILVEGEKKTDSVLSIARNQINSLVIGLTGVWNWGKDHELNDLLQRFVIKNRQFKILVDSDFKTNNNIKQAIYRLAAKLLDYDCKVDLVIVPGNPESPDEKYGVDDFLMQFTEADRAQELFKLINNSEKITKSKIGKLTSRINKKVKQEYREQKPNQEGKVSSTFERTAGQIVLDRFFNSGKGYITYAGNLRIYDKQFGYYKEINEDHIKFLIADFFDSSFETAGFSKASTIKSSIEYVKIKTYVDPDKVNPAGINVRNGYLKLDYTKDGFPAFSLMPHESNVYFTYYADVEYNPQADDTILQNVLDDMLDHEQQVILLKTIASQFDITKVRQNLGRLRILLLLGVGSNGKDTIREWVSLFIPEGFTNIPLQAFKQADQGRSFGIFDLTKSRINWSSENTTVALDSCQSLKNCSTGDPILVEEKMKQGIQVRANCPFLFNINELPKLEAQQEAILSRYAVVKFPNIFKLNPDPNKSYEKKADPRLKEDPEFIKKHVLSALLNRLVIEFQLIFKEGIDYSINQELMTDIRESSNHLIQFVNDKHLKECDMNIGLDVTYIHGVYLNWCLEEGYISCRDDMSDKDFTIDRNSKIEKYNHPNNFDRIITNPREMGKRLRNIFPNLEASRNSEKRTISLNFFEK
jgi:phage/plasmid-associated DNA primase